jgi:hypothetical protein
VTETGLVVIPKRAKLLDDGSMKVLEPNG